ncbi:MAG TPA: copper resistance CopC family protein [Aquiluna sp.]
MKLRWLAALIIALMGLSQPSFAHDELVDQSPRANEVVEAGIIAIELTFSNDLIALGDGSGSEIVILNSDGDPVNNGCAVVDGNIATAKADISEPGAYQVGWRAVSSDGHPISDSFFFEVINSTGYESDPDYVFTTCANPYNPQTTEIEFENPEFIYWILFGSLGLVALGLFFLLRPKKNLG